MVWRTAALFAFLVACGDPRAPCMTERDCEDGESCINGSCLAPDVDAGRQDAPGADAPAADAPGADAPAADTGDPPTTEVACFDGRDDDGDGLPDCADPDCADIGRCLPRPDGWTIPGVAETVLPDDDSACAVGSERLRATLSLEGGDFGCSACTCGAPSGISCSTRAAYCSDSSCVCTTAPTGGAGCYASPDAFLAHRLMPGTATGSCGASGPSTYSPEAFTVTEELRVCGHPSGGAGCDGAEVCAPQAAACVTQEGEQHCPDGYGRRRVAYRSLEDDRACSDCSCQFQSAGCGVLTGFSGPGCTGSRLFDVRSAGGCGMANPVSIRLDETVVSPSCRGVGGRQEGCVRGAEAVTVCCADPGPRCPTEGTVMVEIADGAGFFCMDAHEVTNAQYEAFLDARPDPSTQPEHCLWNSDFVPEEEGPGADPASPVVGVDWCDAHAYCASVGKRLCGAREGPPLRDGEGGSMRSEWAFACTSGFTREAPSEFSGNGRQCPRGGNEGSSLDYPCCRSPEGVYGLMQGVHEWLDACENRRGRSDNCDVADADGDSRCEESLRDRNRDDTDEDLGFRCCADPG